MRKKKVLFLINSLRGGGAEKVLVNLVNYLDANKYDITVGVLFGDGVNKQFLHQNIKVKRFFKKAPKGFVYLAKLFSPSFLHRLFIKERYDVEISFLQGVCTRIIGGAPEKIPIVTWIHNFDRPDRIFRSQDEKKNILKKSSVVACVSKYVAGKVVENGYEKANVRVIYNIQDIDTIVTGAKEPVPEIEKEDRTKIVSIGTLYSVKGYARLILSLAKLLDEGFQFHMYFVGDGPQRQELESLTKEKGLSNRITFFGFDKNPYKYLSKADMFVCSSYTEGFSGVVSEATILGIPTLTTRCAGMEEILGENNEYGIIVDNSDEALFEGLKKVLSDPNVLKEYKKRVQKRKDFFNPSTTIKDVENLIDSL